LTPLKITLYTKDGCGLCEEAKQVLQSLQAEFPHQLTEIDIEADPALLRRYHDRIPVVQIGPYTLEAPIEEINLRVALQSALASPQTANETASNVSRGQAIFLNRFLFAISRHWLALFNLLVLLYVGIPFLAPLFMKAGLEGPARLIYSIYSPLCHQLPYRSWFLFGEQAAYPLAAAGVGGETFQDISSIAPYDLSTVRLLIGDAQIGYKVALCERDVAIYGAILLGGLLFALVRHRLKPIPVWMWFVVGILPIALDGGSQLLSALPFFNFPIRESTPILRTITGTLFGLANVGLAYPYVEEAMQDTRTLVASKLAAAGELG
jgi:uncharacterized membrane protein/glutaredoxin